MSQRTATSEHHVRLLDDTDADHAGHGAGGSDSATRTSTACDVDGILSAIGEFGWFQKRHYLLMNWTWVINALVTFNLVFVSPVSVPWRCRPARTGHNLHCNSTGVHDSAGSAALLCDSGMLGTDEWEFTNPRHTVTAEFMLVCEDAWKVPLLTSLYFVGFGIGSPLFGAACDWIGRRKTYIATLAGTAVSLVGSTMPTGYAAYAALRLLTGMFAMGWVLASYSLCSEFIGKGKRGPYMLGAQLFRTLGEILLAAVAVAVKDWREQTLVLAVFMLPSVVGAVTIL